MRLASKIFLTSALVIVVLGAVGALSLRAVDRLVDVNRDIATRAVPAMQAAVAARETVPTLVRLEARLLVLRDARYESLWDGQATRVQQELERLSDAVASEQEVLHLAEVSDAFERYGQAVREVRRLLADAQTERAVALSEGEARTQAERMETELDALAHATRAWVLAAQAEAAQLEARTWTGVLLALAAAVGLALLATGVVAYGMTRSLQTLSAATAAVAAGSWEAPIAVESRDEIGRLAESFNTMAGRLRRMEETKKEFFATVSHELRSPLTSIRGAVDLLRERVPGPLTTNQGKLVDIVGQSADRLLRLVNQILEVSRLRAGLMPLARAPVDLDRVLTAALNELRLQADEARVRLECERVGADFTITGDVDRLHQVVVNLGANAIRFTPPGGRVVARLVDAGAEVELQVEDTGVGIPQDALPFVFDAYRQAHTGRGGTGLGLAVVQGVASAHGGRVTVESQEGKGSRFTVLLPRA
ncbi:MAG: HAMP domain-containing protein [Candidatus Rokubacteria bacterium]|nr:HAMP domain-containing protein [Candidatus Rokubacteria bacterium]